MRGKTIRNEVYRNNKDEIPKKKLFNRSERIIYGEIKDSKHRYLRGSIYDKAKKSFTGKRNIIICGKAGSSAIKRRNRLQKSEISLFTGERSCLWGSGINYEEER